jgi:hypothetical protein
MLRYTNSECSTERWQVDRVNIVGVNKMNSLEISHVTWCHCRVVVCTIDAFHTPLLFHDNVGSGWFT